MIQGIRFKKNEKKRRGFPFLDFNHSLAGLNIFIHRGMENTKILVTFTIVLACKRITMNNTWCKIMADTRKSAWYRLADKNRLSRSHASQ